MARLSRRVRHLWFATPLGRTWGAETGSLGYGWFGAWGLIRSPLWPNGVPPRLKASATRSNDGLGYAIRAGGVAEALNQARRRAASLAWYVMRMPAPARLIEVRTSSIARSPSIQPLAAAALSM